MRIIIKNIAIHSDVYKIINILQLSMQNHSSELALHIMK